MVNPVYTEPSGTPNPIIIHHEEEDDDDFQDAESYPSTQTLSLEAQEIEMIKRALVKNHGKRKKAADELGISERTLYRKIKQYELED
jgi:transcriptional regulator with PAS, ATPase and Fis domain